MTAKRWPEGTTPRKAEAGEASALWSCHWRTGVDSISPKRRRKGALSEEGSFLRSQALLWQRLGWCFINSFLGLQMSWSDVVKGPLRLRVRCEWIQRATPSPTVHSCGCIVTVNFSPSLPLILPPAPPPSGVESFPPTPTAQGHWRKKSPPREGEVGRFGIFEGSLLLISTHLPLPLHL